MMTWEQIKKVHEIVAPEAGGTKVRYEMILGGIKDNKQLAHEVIKFHPFFDGNKRTAMTILWYGLIPWKISSISSFEDRIKFIVEFHKEELELLKEV